AGVSLGFCAWRLHGTERPGRRRPNLVNAVGFTALIALIIDYGRAFRVAPLNRYDAWAIWALKGHALYAFGWADPVVFAGASYRFANLDYPLLLPSLEAIDFRAMGAFDTRLLHVQFLLFLVAVFLGLLLVARRRWRALAVAAAVDVALVVPWRIYTSIHHLHDINYSLLDSFDYGHIHARAGVGPIAFRTLGGQMVDPGQWGLLVPISATIVIVALATGPRKLALFALVWTLVSWLGLSWIYVISHYEYSYYLDSTKERVVASIVVGLAALTPLIAAEAWNGFRGIRRERADGG